MSENLNPLLTPRPMRMLDELAWCRARFAYVVAAYRNRDRAPLDLWLQQIAERNGNEKTGIPARTIAEQCRFEVVKFARSDKELPR